MQSIEDQPLVSVVIATYNMGQYLAVAVESVCAGSYQNIEVIIIDDGSTDDTSIAIQPCLKDPRVRYIQQENKGQPKAKNHGLREAKGTYIAFCDADDLWEPNKLALQIPLFDNPKVGIVYSEVSYIDEKSKRYQRSPTYTRYTGIVTKQLLLKNFVPFGTSVIRRQCIEQSGFFNEKYKMGIDWELWLRYSLEWEFAYIPDKTYVYREWSGQMSTNYRGRYDHAFAILRDFEHTYGDKLDRRDLRKAWADNYINRAAIYAKNEKTVVKPLMDVMQGIYFDPLNITGWKVFVKVVTCWYSLVPRYRLELKRLAEVSGVLVVMRFVSRMRPRILMYHRIIDQPNIQGIKPSDFERQMAYVAKRFRVIPVSQLVEEIQCGQLKPYSLALTFDDGHADFYTNAWPILQQYKLPATLYVTTGFIDKKEWLWPDLLKYILLHASESKFSLPGLGDFSLSKNVVLTVWSDVGDHCLALPVKQRHETIEALASQLGVTIPEHPVAPFSAVSWEQLVEMKAQGLDVGSHTVTHPILAGLDKEQLHHELSDSRDRIDEKLGCHPAGICYPNGREQDVDEEVIEQAKALHYQYGLLACNTELSNDSLFMLGRVAATPSHTDLKWQLEGFEKPRHVGEAMQKIL